MNWPYYVYELIDPRDDTVFYVGKGKGNRIAYHEREARKGACSEKCLKINEIWASGFEVVRRFVAFFREESHAYDFEEARIASYGLPNLTNVMPGGGGIRERGYVCNKPAPWNSMVAAKTIAKHSAVAAWLAVFLRAKDKQGKVTIEGDKWGVAIGRAALDFLPSVWEMICQDREALLVIEPSMRQHGIEFSYGSANA